jgi:polysaccharide deacetylase family protein (PEP-CTERM system associated)
MPNELCDTPRPLGLPARRAADGRVLNAMSCDVEEYFQVGAFETCVVRAQWDTLPSRVVYNTGLVLDLFARHRVQVTFFTLGWVAQRHPDLIRRIVAEGHELASHGVAHDRVHTLTPERFRTDLRQAKAMLEDAGGVAVNGYRAPSFSIGKANSWALEILAEEGYAYSSSVAPIQHDHYGWPEFPSEPVKPVAGSEMVEVPMTRLDIGPIKPQTGGGFFRLMPYALTRGGLEKLNAARRQAAVFYFHPWEVDPNQPVFEQAPFKSRFRHYTFLDQMMGKMERLLTDFHWDRMDRVFLEPAGLQAAA